jgi:hypothetical protein
MDSTVLRQFILSSGVNKPLFIIILAGGQPGALECEDWQHDGCRRKLHHGPGTNLIQLFCHSYEES